MTKVLDFRASTYELPKEVHHVVNTPIGRYRSPLYISNEGVFTFQGSVSNKQFLAQPGHNVSCDAWWYDNCIYYCNDSASRVIYKMDLTTKQSTQYNSCTIYNSGHGQQMGIIRDYLFFIANVSGCYKLQQMNLKTGQLVKTVDFGTSHCYSIQIFCDQFFVVLDNPRNFGFYKVDLNGNVNKIQQNSTSDWNDYSLTFGCGMGMLRTQQKFDLIDIMDATVGSLNDHGVSRKKYAHPILGYTFYPEHCEKFAKNYVEYQKSMYADVKELYREGQERGTQTIQVQRVKLSSELKQYCQQGETWFDKNKFMKLVEKLPELMSFKPLENADQYIKIQLVNQIARKPLLLAGRDSEFFFEAVGSYLLNSKTSKKQEKEEFCEAYFMDRCLNYRNQKIILQIVVDLTQQIKQMQIQEDKDKEIRRMAVLNEQKDVQITQIISVIDALQ